MRRRVARFFQHLKKQQNKRRKRREGEVQVDENSTGIEVLVDGIVIRRLRLYLEEGLRSWNRIVQEKVGLK